MFPLPEKSNASSETALAAYVPPLVLDRIAADGRPLSEPLLDRFPCTLLSADIAGFTSLAESLDNRGAGGVEKISQILNGCFSTLIETMEAHGGAVMKFAGDALVALWPARDGATADAARRATRCGLAIQQLAHEGGLASTPLALRIGIGSGEILHMVLGEARARWMSAVAGPALAQADAASLAATPGAVFASAQAWALLGDGYVGEINGEFVRVSTAPRAGNLAPVERPRVHAFSAEALLPHISQAARDRIGPGLRGWHAEFRPLTVLFIHVAEADIAAGDLLQRSQGIVRVIQSALDHFEGALDDLDDEAAGLTAVAAFGLPPLSHEDDAARAVEAAMRIRSDLQVIGVSCAIGITTGRVFCGSIGNETRRAFSLIGDAMNRCARLMQRANGEILCDGPTCEAAKARIAFEFLGHVAVKGKRDAIMVHRPLRESLPASPIRGGLMGRRDERALLAGRIDVLRRRKSGGLVLIEGDAGIGKSALVAEFLGTAAANGVRAFAGGADSIERMRGYHVWSHIFPAMMEIPGAASHEKRSAHALARLDAFPDIARIAPLLNPVLGLHFPENEITSRMDAASRADALGAALVQMLEASAAREPIVIVIEDCHWLDSASWALALAGAQRVGDALFVLVSRPMEERPPQWNALLGLPGATHLRLNPMPPGDVIAMVCDRLGVTEMPAPAIDLILEKAGGHPLFAETLAFELRDSGHIVIEQGRCRIPPGGDDLRQLKFPGTVHGAVRARIDRLPERERLALKAASVIGVAFSPGALRAIHPSRADAERLDDSLEQLSHGGFIKRDREGFAFSHALVQEAAYELMLPSHRGALHRAFAEWIERTAGLEIGAHYPALAHHWTLADARDRAVFYLAKSGEQAISRFANREAVAFLEKAVALSVLPRDADEATTRGRWHRWLGEAHFHLGRIDLSRDHLRRAARLLGFPPPSPLAMKTYALPAALLRQMWHRMRGAFFLRRDPDRGDALLEAIRAYNLLGEMAFFVNDLPTSVFCCIRGLNLAERGHFQAKRAEMFGAMMIVAATIRPRRLAKMYMRLAEDETRGMDEPVVYAYVDELIGIYGVGLGGWDECEARLGSAQTVFGQFGNHRRVEECLANTLYTRMYRGQFEESVGALGELLRSAARRGDTQTIGWSRCVAATHALPVEGGDAALRAIGTDPSIAADTLSRAAFPAIVAAAHLYRGDLEAARRDGESALDFLARLPPVSSSMLFATSFTAEVFVDLLARALSRGDRAAGELRSAAKRACSASSRFARAFPIGEPRALLWGGAMEFLSGNEQRAEKSWTRALDLSSKMGMRHDCGTIHLQIAKLADGERRNHHARLAEECFTLSGAHADAGRAHALARG